MDRENRRKVKLEKDLKSTIAELEVRTMEAKSKQNQVLMADEEYKRCEQQLRETRVSVYWYIISSRKFLAVQYIHFA